jgi:hypothetical protein
MAGIAHGHGLTDGWRLDNHFLAFNLGRSGMPDSIRPCDFKVLKIRGRSFRDRTCPLFGRNHQTSSKEIELDPHSLALYLR